MNKVITIVFYLIFISETLYLINLLIVKYLLLYLQTTILQEISFIQNFVLIQIIIYIISKIIVFVHKIIIKTFNIIPYNNFILEFSYSITFTKN